MTAAATAAASVARSLAAKTKLGEALAAAKQSRSTDQTRVAAGRAAISARAYAEAQGATDLPPCPTAAELGEMEARIVGYTAAIDTLQLQLPSAEAAIVAAEQALRAEQARHVRQVIVPPLLAAAKEAGAVFGRAIAQLAAAQDAALHLQRRPGDGYVTGDAGTLMTAMGATGVVNVFFDAGAARTALDWSGYAEAAGRIEDELREWRA